MSPPIPPEALPLPWPEIDEAEFAKKTGLALDVLREIRRTSLKAQDWLRKKNRVILTSSGVEAVLRATGALGAVLPELPAEKVPAVALRVPITRLCGNPRLVKATVAGELVTVRVKGNERFRQGQEIEILPPIEGGILWRHVPEKKRRGGRPAR